MAFKLVHRFNLPAVYWSKLADGMCVNKLNVTALSSIMNIEVPHLRVCKALFLNNLMWKSHNGWTGHVTTHLTNIQISTLTHRVRLRLSFDILCCAMLLDYGLDISDARVRVGLPLYFLL